MIDVTAIANYIYFEELLHEYLFGSLLNHFRSGQKIKLSHLIINTTISSDGPAAK